MPDMRPSPSSEFRAITVGVCLLAGLFCLVFAVGVKFQRARRRLAFADCILALPKAHDLVEADVERCAK